MESKGLKQHTIDSVISSIDSWYKKEAENYLNKVNFGIKNDEETDVKKYRFLKAFDNIVCRDMKCDLRVTNELLEAVSVYTKTSTFKDLSIDYTLKKKEGKKPFNEIRRSKSTDNDDTPPFTKVLIYINEVLRYEQFCGLDLKFALVNSLGNTVSSTYDGTNIVIQDQRVSNSDDTYDVNVASGVDLELPDITISNSNDSYSVTSPSVKDVDLPNITLANSDGSLTASIPSAQDVTITDVTISNSDSSYSASSPYNPNLSVPDITVSNSDDSYSVTSPSVIDVDIPDEAITLNSAAFITKPSKKDQDILLKDVSGTTITPESLSGNTITILDAVVDTGWSRPTEWLTMPSISATDKVLYALVLVYENGENLITFGADLNRVTINWGDGSATENTQGLGSINTHNYDYSAITQTPITYEGQNVKQCIFTATIISSSSIDMRFINSAGINSSGNNAIVDILCCFNARSVRLSISNQYQNQRRMDDLRIFKCLDLGNDASFFWANYSWNTLKLEIFDIPTNGLSTHRANNRTFLNTIINQPIGDISGFGSSFNGAVLNGGVGNITARGSDYVDATLVTCNDITVVQQDAFTRCKVNILGSITATTTDFRRLFQGCTTKRLVFASLPSQPTNMANNNGCFAYMGYLEEMIVPGLQNGFTIAGSNMGATALDAMFTSLGTANGTQTITITGNPGAATCDTTIATLKGFTIVI